MTHLSSISSRARAWHAFAHLTVLLLVAAFAGCGNDSNDQAPGDPGGGGGPPGRGRLLENSPALVTTLSAGNFLPGLSEPARQALLLQAGAPVCDVAVYKIRYATVGGRDEATDASGALMVPGGIADRCRGGRPIVLYAHGTSTEKTFDLTRLDDAENAEGLYLAAFFAAQGYIVVAPNYAGYDTSSLPSHPYLIAAAQSNDMVDALTAARSALPVAGPSGATDDDGRLYVTGTRRAGTSRWRRSARSRRRARPSRRRRRCQARMPLRRFSTPSSAGRVSGGASVFGSYLFTAYEHAYGDVYGSPTDLFESPYAAGIDTLLPSALPRSQLYDQGLLPRAFFASMPPSPAYADITPATTPAELAVVFAQGFATAHLVTNAFRLAYLQDAEAHPDGGWPQLTSAEPAANPGLPLRQRLAQNDLRNWAPRAPTLLCGGHDDPTVFWLNTQLMEAYWASHAASAPYTVLDVDADPSGSSDPYEDLKRALRCREGRRRCDRHPPGCERRRPRGRPRPVSRRAGVAVLPRGRSGILRVALSRRRSAAGAAGAVHCRRRKPVVRPHHLGFGRIAFVGRRHDLHAVLVEHVEDVGVQGGVLAQHAARRRWCRR